MLVYTRVPRSKPKKGKNKVVKTRKVKHAFTPKKAPVEERYRAPGTEHLPSKIQDYLENVEPKNPQPQRYEGDMAQREAAAQREKQRKSKCVAPAFNKGPDDIHRH